LKSASRQFLCSGAQLLGIHLCGKSTVTVSALHGSKPAWFCRCKLEKD
jgi:hypothetical protein